MRGNILPTIFDFPSFRVPSMLEEMDDLFKTVPNAIAQGGLTVSEDEKKIYVEAAIPGVDPKDVEVTLDRGTLWIRGETRKEEKSKDKKFYRQAQQSFSYRVAIPGDADPNAEPVATCEHGVIQVTFPKAPQAKAKRIAVTGSKSEKKQLKMKEGK